MVKSIKNQNVFPKHIAIIMDGNGRWATNQGKPRLEGHRAGADAVDRTMKACRDNHVKVLSLFAFSTENWKRPKAEVSGLFELLNYFLDKKLADLKENRIQFRVSGDLSQLPLKNQKKIQDAVETTSHFDEFILNVCINYGSRDEIAMVIGKLLKNCSTLPEGQIKKPEWDEISDYLYTSGLPDVDLLIRTAGERRLSNFLLLQSAYAELFFTDTLWPDFGEKDLGEALSDYSQRVRKFGAVLK